MQLIITDDFLRNIVLDYSSNKVSKIEPFFLSNNYVADSDVIALDANVFYFVKYFSNGDGALQFKLDSNIVMSIETDTNKDSYILVNEIDLSGVSSRNVEVIGWKITTE